MYGQIIKTIRKQRGMTQKEIYSGVVSASFYSDFEKGKHSMAIEKFERILVNLGISYNEFNYYKDNQEEKELDEKIDKLYHTGKFEELYSIYEDYHNNSKKELRFLATKAYLLVLLTNRNYYKFSRQPFNEIKADLNQKKKWSLTEIKLAKLVLLSLSEKTKKEMEPLFIRISSELDQYQEIDEQIYYRELSDLFFNHIQSLLIINDICAAQQVLKIYMKKMEGNDFLEMSVHYFFISLLVSIYIDYPCYMPKIEGFVKQMLNFKVSETHFFQLIMEIHLEKAKNYYERSQKLELKSTKT